MPPRSVSAPDWPRVEATFVELLELSESERNARLEGLERDEPELAAEVSSLLEADGGEDRLGLAVSEALDLAVSLNEPAPERIGPY
ncbi:MAG: hypothetical protein MI919_08540, partial [Holophagales bacterium]|nr:hypothetical protein [Holophagales bacterium]